jgi:hypothetical protein
MCVKNKTIIRLLVLFLVLFLFDILCGFSYNSETKSQENKAKLFKKEKPTDETVTHQKQKAIEFIKCVYDIKEGIYFPKVEDTCIIDGKKCYVIYPLFNSINHI